MSCERAESPCEQATGSFSPLGQALTASPRNRVSSDTAEEASRKPIVIFVVTEDWYFWSHRLPIARAARDSGYAVWVVTREKSHGERIRKEGFQVWPLDFHRTSLN